MGLAPRRRRRSEESRERSCPLSSATSKAGGICPLSSFAEPRDLQPPTPRFHCPRMLDGDARHAAPAFQQPARHFIGSRTAGSQHPGQEIRILQATGAPPLRPSLRSCRPNRRRSVFTPRYLPAYIFVFQHDAGSMGRNRTLPDARKSGNPFRRRTPVRTRCCRRCRLGLTWRLSRRRLAVPAVHAPRTLEPA